MGGDGKQTTPTKKAVTSSDILMKMIYENSRRGRKEDNFEAIKKQFNTVNYGNIIEVAKRRPDRPVEREEDGCFYDSIVSFYEGKFKSLSDADKMAFTAEVMRFQETPQDIYWEIKTCPYGSGCKRKNRVHIFAQHTHKLINPATIISEYMNKKTF